METQLFTATIDGQVCLVRLVCLVRMQTDNFRFVSWTNFCLHYEQMGYGLRKIAWAYVFRMKRQYI
jgi:hypothetical protein